MNGSKLIIVEGGEAVGKSSIRDEMVHRLGIKYLSKDAIKEKMFDEGTVSTWNYSYYEKRAKNELLRRIKKYLAGGQSFIVEANFKPWDRRKLKAILNEDIQVYEIFCSTKGFTAFRRFVKRNESGHRHRGHHDRRWYLTVFTYSLCNTLKIKWPYHPMKLSDKVLYLDTTDLSRIDYESIIEFIT